MGHRHHITYIPMKSGFMYLCAVIDLYSRYVVGWGVSNTMSAEWCAGIMEEATGRHGAPEIVNTDQGSQFGSEAFTGLLKEQGIEITPFPLIVLPIRHEAVDVSEDVDDLLFVNSLPAVAVFLDHPLKGRQVLLTIRMMQQLLAKQMDQILRQIQFR